MLKSMAAVLNDGCGVVDASLPLSLQREFASQRRFLQAVVVVEETAKHVCCALHAGHDPARTPETGVSSAGASVAHVDRATPP